MTDADLLAPGYLDDLEARSIEDIRSMRAECMEVETGLSYLRRMVQGPLDIVTSEQQRRAGDASGTHTDLAALVDDLPTVLADGTRSAGVGRLPTQLEPTRVDAELEAALHAVLADSRLGEVPAMSDGDLAGLADALRGVEARVSARRRAFHERIDALQAELTRRYRDGEASVESLLE